MTILKFITHSKFASAIAQDFGWLPGAKYTNLRDIRSFEFSNRGFLDINWKAYNFDKHLEAVQKHTPLITVARDVENIFDLDEILVEAEELKKHSKQVIIVPKDKRLSKSMQRLIPKEFLLGYSVPTRYGKTPIPPECFERPVHLLGGRPDHQYKLSSKMSVHSIDCNRFTLDAKFGDYFDGEKFRPHPVGGYEQCIRDSIKNINKIWEKYEPQPAYS